ncbi:hypothetical protein ACHAXS_006438 [Conticribra weissflogii]
MNFSSLALSFALATSLPCTSAFAPTSATSFFEIRPNADLTILSMVGGSMSPPPKGPKPNKEPSGGNEKPRGPPPSPEQLRPSNIANVGTTPLSAYEEKIRKLYESGQLSIHDENPAIPPRPGKYGLAGVSRKRSISNKPEPVPDDQLVQTMSDSERDANLKSMRQLKSDMKLLLRAGDGTGFSQAETEFERLKAEDPWYGVNERLMEACKREDFEQKAYLDTLVEKLGGAPPMLRKFAALPRGYVKFEEIYDVPISIDRLQNYVDLKKMEAELPKLEKEFRERHFSMEGVNKRKARPELTEEDIMKLRMERQKELQQYDLAEPYQKMESAKRMLAEEEKKRQELLKEMFGDKVPEFEDRDEVWNKYVDTNRSFLAKDMSKQARILDDIDNIVRITNNSSTDTVQLLSRRFEIQTVGSAMKDVVQGEGVTGRQPVLKPGEVFEYTSTAPLSVRPIGTTEIAARMSGEYRYCILKEGQDKATEEQVNKGQGEAGAELATFHFVFPEEQRVKPVRPSDDDEDDDDEDVKSSAVTKSASTQSASPAASSPAAPAATSTPASSLPGEPDMTSGNISITPNDSSDTVTSDVRVVVTSTYRPERSDAKLDKHCFAYNVRITNESKTNQSIQLVSRRFEIQTIGSANKDVVQGPGVTGRQPTLKPGESFEYTSTAPLSVRPMQDKTNVVARMSGEYNFVQLADDGTTPLSSTPLKAELGAFHFILPE